MKVWVAYAGPSLAHNSNPHELQSSELDITPSNRNPVEGSGESPLEKTPWHHTPQPVPVEYAASSPGSAQLYVL